MANNKDPDQKPFDLDLLDLQDKILVQQDKGSSIIMIFYNNDFNPLL